MNAVKSIRPDTAAEAVERHIEDLILEGSLRPGMALLSERELAEKLDVSRPTLRVALKSLEERGLLAKAARGVEVAQLGAKSMRDPLLALLGERAELADDYLEFRDLVEREAAAMAALRATPGERARIDACAQQVIAAHGRNDPEAEAEADADLHVAIYEASHNLVLLQIMGALSGGLRHDVLQNRAQIFHQPQIRDALRDQHLDIAKAIIAGDADAARGAAHRHLDFVRKALQDIRAAAAQEELAQRRMEKGGLSAVKR